MASRLWLIIYFGHSAILTLIFGQLGYSPYRWGYLELGIYAGKGWGLWCFYMFTIFFAINFQRIAVGRTRGPLYFSLRLLEEASTLLLFAIVFFDCLKNLTMSMVWGSQVNSAWESVWMIGHQALIKV